MNINLGVLSVTFVHSEGNLGRFLLEFTVPVSRGEGKCLAQFTHHLLLNYESLSILVKPRVAFQLHRKGKNKGPNWDLHSIFKRFWLT